jgi:hypothetical protein
MADADEALINAAFEDLKEHPPEVILHVLLPAVGQLTHLNLSLAAPRRSWPVRGQNW